MGWTLSFVLTMLIGGIAVLVVFCLIELCVFELMFYLNLFRICVFVGGNIVVLLVVMGCGGMQFILIIWL